MTRQRRHIFLAAICGGIVASSALADTIVLRDGTLINGIIKQIDGGYDVALPDGKHRFVASEEAKSIKLDNVGKVTEGNARERLTSLQRSVDSEHDVDRIIERYEQFIGMNANTDAAKLAQADLAQWRDRKAKQMIKVGRRWLTPAERDESLIAAAKMVDQINAMISVGEIDEASATLRKLVEEEPENVSYQYLNGVMQLRREQFYEAKRSFDAVAERIDNHAPTVLNLAVLAAQFKRWPQAVAQVEQAMLLAPGSQEVLDDVIELSQIAPETTRRTAGFERLMKRSVPLEAALQQRQATRGLYRFGGTWADKATLDKFKADKDAFEKKKADMDKDFQDTQDAIKRDDEQIQFVQRMIGRIEADSLTQGADGTVIRRRYPSSYYDLQRDLDTLQAHRAAATKHVADLRAEADKVKASEPKPPFAGKLTPIDHRGVPVILPQNATSRPATVPTGEAQPMNDLPATMPITQPESRGLFE